MGFFSFCRKSRAKMKTKEEKQREFWKEVSSANKQIEFKLFIKRDEGKQSDGWHQIVHNGEVVQVVHYQDGIVRNLSGAPCSVVLSKEGFEKGLESLYGWHRTAIPPELVPTFSTDWFDDFSWEIFNTDAQAWFQENFSIIKEYYTDKDNPEFLHAVDISEYETKHVYKYQKNVSGHVLVYDGEKLLFIENLFNGLTKHWINPAFISFDLETTQEALEEIGFESQKTDIEWYWYNNVSDHSFSGDYTEFLDKNIDFFIKALSNERIQKEQESQNSKPTDNLEIKSENKKMTDKKTSKAASIFLSNEKKEAYKNMLKNTKHLAVIGVEDFKKKVDSKDFSGIVAFYNEGDKRKKDLKEVLVFNNGNLHNLKGPARVLIANSFEDSELVTNNTHSLSYENYDFENNQEVEAYAFKELGIIPKKEWDKSVNIGFSLDDLIYNPTEVEELKEVKKSISTTPVAATKLSSIKQTVKSDLSEVATRVAVKKSTEMLSQVVIDFLASNKKGTEASAMKKKVKDLLSTKDGLAAFQLLIGALMPILASHDKVPENIKDVISQVSKGFRTDGMTHFAVEFVDYLSGPAAEQARQTIVKAFEGFKKIDDLASGNINIESQIRALTEPTSLFLVPTEKEEEELDYVSTDEVAATKAKLKSSKLK